MTRERRREIAAESVLRSLRQSLISYLPPFFATLPHDDGERRPPFLYASIDPRYLNLCRAPFKTPKWRFIRWPPTILFSWNNLNNLALLLLLPHRSGSFRFEDTWSNTFEDFFQGRNKEIGATISTSLNI